jgi:hypothetical protein
LPFRLPLGKNNTSVRAARCMTHGKLHAGAGTALGRAAGIGRNVIMIRNAPMPMAQEPT